MLSPPELPSFTETGRLQVMHLKRYWNKAILTRNGQLKQGSLHEEWNTDTTLLAALGLGLEQTIQYLYQTAPTFEQFENWIEYVSGGSINAEKTNAFNQLFFQKKESAKQLQSGNLLTADERHFWEQNGYIIVRNTVSREYCDQTIEAICNFIDADRYNADTWYKDHPEKKGIMVQLFQHPALEKNRQSNKIRKTYEELWKRTDLFVNTDRVGFNPPETESYSFQGPRLHWDVSLKLPIPFGLQGILYLADTAENQGALTLVPGFHHKIEQWLVKLPQGANPRTENLYALGIKSIAANAGDFIIWRHDLPHGGSPNTAELPRFAQYINYEPADKIENEVWI